MIDVIADLLRTMLGVIGLLALADPGVSGSLLTVAVAAFAAALVVLATHVARAGASQGASRAHPTRRAELSAPLAQSDPDAAGHIRRRGPGPVLAAA